MKNKELINKESSKRLRAAREALKISRTEATERFGWNYNTYKAHESGDRGIGKVAAAKYAKALGVTINHLLAIDLISNKNHSNSGGEEELRTHHVPIYGQAAGGLWLEGEDVPFDEDPIALPFIAGYPDHTQYARKVVGNSVNKHIQDGDYAIFQRYEYYGKRIEVGKLVDCKRERSGLAEHTVKVFAGDRLMSDSHDLTEQVSLPLAHEDTDTIVTIEGIVIGLFRRF
jgi:transcriptional regulator with XRE-family HTH domain